MVREECGDDCSTEQKKTCVETGFCEAHHVEIERRENVEHVIENLKEVTKNIPHLLTAVNRMIGYSILATIIILGSYAFTAKVERDSHDTALRMQAKIEVVDQKNTELLIQLKELNANLSSLIKQNDRRIDEINGRIK